MIYFVLFGKFLIMNESVCVFGRQGPTQSIQCANRTGWCYSVLVQIFSRRQLVAAISKSLAILEYPLPTSDKKNRLHRPLRAKATFSYLNAGRAVELNQYSQRGPYP